ncbi:dipeptidyl-peptidase-like protein V precursor [Saccharata proteae CBS 121410]|uniref:Dipeptidyl-peptidase V n=1 Tax=Saccharata proteae CBS 121410 TaxID=1314787 RepID=A0A9P4LXZ3_9PEZI|nr:dipeptidyl-peptidase-like protein V precursor [Saccharata proteae CBS 121410]
MTIRATKFTPEVLLSAPRRSAGVPNADGSKVLYTVSTYSFSEHSSTSQVRVLDTSSGESQLVSDNSDASEPTWLANGDVLLLTPGSNGTTDVVVGPVDGFKNSYTAGTIGGSASGVKLASLGNGTYAFAITAQAKPDGTIYNSETAETSKSTGRLYKAIFVRHWDSWITPNRNTIFYGSLSKDGSKYKLSSLVNALAGTSLESPVPPFGGTDNFDISSSGIAFVAKDPGLIPALYTKINVYLISLSTFTESTPPAPFMIPTPGYDGQATSPVFSPNGTKLAFAKMKQIQYESDKLQLFIMPDVRRPGWVYNPLATANGEGAWDRSVSAITWSADASWLYLTAENLGRISLFEFPANTNPHNSIKPKLVFEGGSVSDARIQANGDVFITATSLIDNSAYFKYTPGHPSPVQISSNSKNGSSFGLHREQVSEVWYPGAANGTQIHAWVMKPSNFNPDVRYPLAYLIHGGPQGSWEDSWSTRWNPAVFAEQGYVVVMPNPTGSTGYGQHLTDAIQDQWGGLPYQDLVNGFKYVEENMDYVDTSRAVELGASYGGYMTNWIQGHDLGRKFKALVTHDGVFSMTSQMSSEELWFPEHDLGGKFWANRSSWTEWDPSKHTDKWATPHLIIHNELDYRLTIAEGLSAFNVLQDRGVESQFLSFPDENHWVLKPENSLLWHTVVFDWINSHVGLPKYSDQSTNASALEESALQNRASDIGLKN